MDRPRDLIVLHPTHLDRQQRSDFERIVQLRDSNSSALVREASSEKSRHVVMPLRL